MIDNDIKIINLYLSLDDKILCSYLVQEGFDISRNLYISWRTSKWHHENDYDKLNWALKIIGFSHFTINNSCFQPYENIDTKKIIIVLAYQYLLNNELCNALNMYCNLDIDDLTCKRYLTEISKSNHINNQLLFEYFIEELKKYCDEEKHVYIKSLQNNIEFDNNKKPKTIYDSVSFREPTNVILTNISQESKILEIEGYPINPNSEKHCFVFNDSKNRKGSKFDLELINSVLRDLIKYKIHPFEMESKEDLISELDKIRQTDYHTDLLFCIFLCHGTEGLVYVRGEEVEIQYILDCFIGRNCIYFRGKPKLFLFQSCRGNNLNPVMTVEINKPIKPIKQFSPSMSLDDMDYFIVFATTPYKLAGRHPGKGSIFIQELLKIVKQNYETCIEKTTIHSIFGLVIQFNKNYKDYIYNYTNPKTGKSAQYGQVAEIKGAISKNIFLW